MMTTTDLHEKQTQDTPAATQAAASHDINAQPRLDAKADRARREDLAVLVVDVAGYSMLMKVDEDDTAARLINIWSTLLEPGVVEHQGRIVNSTGDGFLAS